MRDIRGLVFEPLRLLSDSKSKVAHLAAKSVCGTTVIVFYGCMSDAEYRMKLDDVRCLFSHLENTFDANEERPVSVIVVNCRSIKGKTWTTNVDIREFLKDNARIVDYWEELYYEFFQYEKTPLDHKYAPLSIVLIRGSDPERPSPDDCTQIRSTDVACKFYGARPGDVMRVTRACPANGRVIENRYVVDPDE